MVFIHPRFLVLVGLCAVASLSWAAPSTPDGVQMRRSPPADPDPAGAIAALVPTDNESVDVKIQTSDTPEKDNDDNPMESTANQSSMAKDKPPATASSKQPKGKKPAAGSTALPRALGDDMDQAHLDKRTSRPLYLRDYRLHESPSWPHRHHPFHNRQRSRSQRWKHKWNQGWKHYRKQGWNNRPKRKNVQAHSDVHRHAHIHKHINKHRW